MNFGEGYARSYDAFYRNKDYAGEAAFVCERLQKAANRRSLDILDVGCGTGLHDVQFVAAGHSVLGIDRSAQMLARAAERRNALIPALRHRLEFQLGDARTLRVARAFDAVVSLFHVMSYMAGEGDFDAALETARKHLVAGGAFLFDFWYGPAVLADPPQRRERTIESAGIRTRRLTVPHHDRSRETVRVVFDVEQIDLATAKVNTTSEEHVMRYFFDDGLRKSLSNAGFDMVELREWATGKPPTPSSFGVYVLAKAI